MELYYGQLENNMSQIDPETKKRILAIHDGTLANGIDRNIRYGVSGALVGAAVGIIIATIFSKGRMVFGICGAVAGCIGGVMTTKLKI